MADRTLPEEWRPIAGYEGRYDVSSHGRVRSWVKRGNAACVRQTPVIRVLGRGGQKGQYEHIGLTKDGVMKTRYVHQLVLEAFVGPRPPGQEAAHDDGIGDHNWVENLIWKTKKDNHADKHRHGTRQCGEQGGAHKLTNAQVAEIIADARKTTGTVLAQRYGVGHTTIYKILNGHTWPHLTGKAA